MEKLYKKKQKFSITKYISTLIKNDKKIKDKNLNEKLLVV